MKRTLSHVLIVCGVAIVVLAIALPFFLVPAMKVLPLDTVSQSETRAAEAKLLDASALASGKPLDVHKDKPECKPKDKKKEPALSCFMGPTEVKAIRYVTMQAPADDKVVTFEAGQTLQRTDRQEPHSLVTASVDRITLDRKTAFPVPEPTSSYEITAPATGNQPAETPQFTRDGYQYQFSFGTDKKSYPYFDVYALESKPIDFVAEEEQEGVKVYKFHQTVGPVSLHDSITRMATSHGVHDLSEGHKQVLASMRLKFPAYRWGLEGDEDVSMDRYYYTERTLRVEPSTGMITNGTEKIFQFYAKDQEEAEYIVGPGREEENNNPKRTATNFTGQWNDETMHKQVTKAKEKKRSMDLAAGVAPWILGVVGVVLAVLGIRMHRNS